MTVAGSPRDLVWRVVGLAAPGRRAVPNTDVAQELIDALDLLDRGRKEDFVHRPLERHEVEADDLVGDSVDVNLLPNGDLGCGRRREGESESEGDEAHRGCVVCCCHGRRRYPEIHGELLLLKGLDQLAGAAGALSARRHPIKG